MVPCTLPTANSNEPVLRLSCFPMSIHTALLELVPSGTLLVTASVIALAAPASAHHSISGQYDLNARIALRGVIERVDWINPHAYVHLDVTEANGIATSWALATVPLPMMRKAGLTKEMLAGNPGEVVTIDVLPGLNGTKQGWIVKITYSDGHFIALSGR